MPKLIIKQEAGSVTRKSKYAKWLSVGGLLLLLITVASAAVLFTKSPVRSSGLTPLSLSSAANSAAKSGYESLYAILGELDTEYEKLASREVDDYQKNLRLLGKSESILSHLNKMDRAARDLGLDVNEQKELLNRHQFYKDYWQAKLHFRELRISRFEGKNDNTTPESVASGKKPELVSEKLPVANASEADVPSDEQPDTEVVVEDIPLEDSGTTKPKKKFQFAKPPEGMELPAGFCDLSNPDSCKPETVQEDLALPDEPDMLPATDDEHVSTEKEELADTPKKKFQFAKPPEGMELPAGFCDLSDPESCKPEVTQDDLILSDETREAPVIDDDASVGEVAEEPKKKFQFAKPPEGMELPAGFCDLSNPESCKPEVENTSEAQDGEEVKKKAVNKGADLGVVEKKSKKSVANSPKVNPGVSKTVKTKNPAKKASSVSRKSTDENQKKVAKPKVNQQATNNRERDFQVLEESLGIPLN